MPLVAAPTQGARTLTELYAGQVPQMRQQGIGLKIGALETLRNKRNEILARIEQRKAEREQKKREREARRQKYLTAGLTLGTTALGAGVGAIGAAGAAGGLTGLQGAALGAGLGASAGGGFAQLAQGDPRGATQVANSAFTFLDESEVPNPFFSRPNSRVGRGTGGGQW
jgi:hypothetical protein